MRKRIFKAENERRRQKKYNASMLMGLTLDTTNKAMVEDDEVMMATTTAASTNSAEVMTSNGQTTLY